MPLTDHRGEHEIDDGALTENGKLNVVGELRKRLREPRCLFLRDGQVFPCR